MKQAFKQTPCRISALIALATCVTTPSLVTGQYQGYGDFYSKQYRGSVTTQATGTNAYMYNKYYRNNPAVSPYISGAVLGSQDLSGSAYTTVVRPEQQRRERAARDQARYVQQRKMQGNIGYTMNPGAYYGGGTGTYSNVKPPKPKSGVYQNHWYGNWNK